ECPRRSRGRAGANPSRLEWVEQEPGQQLGKEVRRLGGHHLAPARAVEDILDPSRPKQECRIRLGVVGPPHRLPPVGRVRDALVAEAVDELDVELSRLAAYVSGAVARVADGDRAVEWL